MNRKEYILKLKEAKSKIDRILLMESEEATNRIFTNFLNKSKSDSDEIDKKTKDIIRIIGQDKFNQAVNAGVNEFKKKLGSLTNMSKSVNKGSDSVLIESIEKGSDIIYDIVGLVIDNIYYLLTGTKLKDETEKTFSARKVTMLSFCPAVFNSVVYQVLDSFLKFSFDKYSKIMTYCCCISAPLSEEYCKQAALRISTKKGYTYTAAFAGLEALDYILKYYKWMGPKILSKRLVAFMFHMSTAFAQKSIMNVTDGKLRSFAFIIGCLLHAAYNYSAIHQ